MCSQIPKDLTHLTLHANWLLKCRTMDAQVPPVILQKSEKVYYVICVFDDEKDYYFLGHYFFQNLPAHPFSQIHVADERVYLK